jgi:hypothetical protein
MSFEAGNFTSVEINLGFDSYDGAFATNVSFALK